MNIKIPLLVFSISHGIMKDEGLFLLMHLNLKHTPNFYPLRFQPIAKDLATQIPEFLRQMTTELNQRCIECTTRQCQNRETGGMIPSSWCKIDGKPAQEALIERFLEQIHHLDPSLNISLLKTLCKREQRDLKEPWSTISEQLSDYEQFANTAVQIGRKVNNLLHSDLFTNMAIRIHYTITSAKMALDQQQKRANLGHAASH